MFTNLAAQVSSLSKQLLASQLQGSQESANMVQASPPSCDSSHGPHPTIKCQMMNPMGELTIEQDQYLAKFPPNQQFNPYAQNYNLGWRNHPNLSWKNSNTRNPMEQMKPLPPPQEKKSRLEETIGKLANMHMEM